MKWGVNNNFKTNLMTEHSFILILTCNLAQHVHIPDFTRLLEHPFCHTEHSWPANLQKWVRHFVGYILEDCAGDFLEDFYGHSYPHK